MSFKSGYVAILGRPNVGKSTLLNTILEEKLAIVTPKAQTTRHRITGIFNDEYSQIIFLDTPGYHESSKPLNQAMLEVVDNVIGDADVICLLVDPKDSDTELEYRLFEKIGKERCVVVINKADTVNGETLESLANGLHDTWGAKEVIAVSALKNVGVKALVDIMKERLPEGPKYFPGDEYTDLNLRFIASEIIRKQVFNVMHQEIPYSTAVQIEEFREPRNKDDLTRIVASIVVERDSQKGMVIGNKGSTIKKIGAQARKEIEDLIDGRVFLDLTVRVEKNWTKDEKLLRELGYKMQ